MAAPSAHTHLNDVGQIMFLAQASGPVAMSHERYCQYLLSSSVSHRLALRNGAALVPSFIRVRRS